MVGVCFQNIGAAVHDVLAALDLSGDASSQRASLPSLLLSAPWFAGEGASALSVVQMAVSELLTVVVLLHSRSAQLKPAGELLAWHIIQGLSPKVSLLGVGKL
jgi:hypothetical protein